MTVNRYVITANIGVTYPAIWSEVIQGAANIPVATPTMPASGTPISNPYGVAAAITIAASGATITAISTGSNSANLSATGLTSGTVFLPNDWAIAVTYSGGTPTWTWVSAQLPQSGASSQVAAVSNPAPPGGQLGTLPQMYFTAGMPIVLDTGSALYGILNGGGYLRNWVQGQDDVNHSWLGN